MFLFHELAGHFQVVFVSQGQNLIFTVVSSHIPFVISVVRLIEVACVVIFRSKLHLPHFDLNFGFSAYKAHFYHFAQCL